jgi:hypothetical protein
MTEAAPLVPPSREALVEALDLSNQLLRNIELSDLPLTNLFLKGARLARLLNDFEMQNILEYEISGYPTAPSGIPSRIWALCRRAGRTYHQPGPKGQETTEVAYTVSVSQLEQEIKTGEAQLSAAADRNVSISSANPNQYVMAPIGNAVERSKLGSGLITSSRW